MAYEVLGRLSEEDLSRYQEVCAMVEVAQSPPTGMTVEEAKQAWIDYYRFIGWMHEEYGIEPEEGADVVTTVSCGIIRLED